MGLHSRAARTHCPCDRRLPGGQLPMSENDRQAAEHLDSMVAGLVAGGSLSDPLWQAAFKQVPRHLFVPRFYRSDQHGSAVVDETSGADWLSGVYADTHLVTTE